ncbi:MAG: phosphodiester glycosidase family protein [Oscillospiraceae bacterium]|nr:phosphodiester glycosidase family protein [Oscillospiraceae bacterium]
MKKHLYGIIFSAVLTAALTFTLLDSFVFEREFDDVPIALYVMDTDDFETTEYEYETPTLTQEVTEVTYDTDTPPDTTTDTSDGTATATAPPTAVPTTAGTTAPTAPPPPPSPPQPGAEVTDWSYKDEKIEISIQKFNGYGTSFFVADVKLSSMSQLKTAFAKDKYGRNITQKVSEMASNKKALFAINGDYYGFREGGLVIRNGMLYRNELSVYNHSDKSLLIDKRGDFHIAKEGVITNEELAEIGVVHGFSFGPPVVVNGKSVVTSLDSKFDPRTAIGQVDDLHYIFVVSEGRIGDDPVESGLCLADLATIFLKRNCHTAYNLDGGGSATMWFNGRTIYSNTNRSISDIIYISRG